MKKHSYKSTLAVIVTLTVCLLASFTPVQAAKKQKEKKVDLNGTYHATIGLQTATELWIEHMGYYEKTNNSTYGTDNETKLSCKSKDNPGERDVMDGEFTDVEIAGNGTYTLKLSGADFAGETTVSQLHIVTDIPVNDDIKFSNISATVNGQSILEFDEGILEDQEQYMEGGMVYLLLNHWRPELIETLSGMGMSEDAENGWNILQGTGDESIEITFTVSGFAYDNEAAVEETSEESDASSADVSSAAADNGNTTEASSSNSSSSTPVVAIVIIIIIVVLIVVGVVVMKKQKK